jgi:DNA mismatch repair protein MutH
MRQRVFRLDANAMAVNFELLMTVEEALPLLQSACGRRFGDIFAGHPEDLRTNKGHAGQLLLRHLGLQLDSKICDFENGELKTNKAFSTSRPRETMWISQISDRIDELLRPEPIEFIDSWIFQKIRNLVYLPVVKESLNAADWYYTRCIHIEVVPGGELFGKLDCDFRLICRGLRTCLERPQDEFIHTTNGAHYLQVRSKDSQPYSPIYSATFSRFVSNKNYGFYFMKAFMLDALDGKLGEACS